MPGHTKEARRQRSVKKAVKERKKDVDILQRHLKGGRILTAESRRLERVLQERGKKIRRNKAGKRIA